MYKGMKIQTWTLFFVSSIFYCFKRKVREYLIKCLKHSIEVKIDLNTIMRINATFLRHGEGTP
jgi:hypothetical protein